MIASQQGLLGITNSPLPRAGAVFSKDRVYRYLLWRVWDDSLETCCFVGVNPSTADEEQDDHTIRKEIGFATRWGFGSLNKVNMFGFVSTDQRSLLDAKDPIGQENDRYIANAFDYSSRIVLCWGSGKTAAVRRLIQRRELALPQPGPATVGTLGTTYDGFPRHPLMLPYDTPFQRVA